MSNEGGEKDPPRPPTEESAREAALGEGGHGHPEAPPATPHEIARRQLLGRVSVGVGLVCGGAISVPGIGFVAAPLFRDAPREWRTVGRIADFRVGHTVSVVFTDASPLPWAGVTSRTAAWLRRVSQTEFVAFSVNCAHLGCPVQWIEDAHLFMCPCHGGVYYEDGRVAAGPPPHPLTRYPVRVDGDEVQIRTDPIPIG